MPAELDLQRLPIVVAVTGHRHLRPGDEPVLAQAVDDIFAELQRAYPSTPLLLLTPLAQGADQLAAEVAQRRSIPYRVPIPMPLPCYREDFTAPEHLARFEELLRAADGPPYAMPFFQSNTETNLGDESRRAHQYALVAAHLARSAHIMIALWDGLPSQRVGGTAQAVRFRVLGVPRQYGRASIVDAAESGPVYQVYAARRNDTPLDHPVGYRSLRMRRSATADAVNVPRSLAEQFAQIAEFPAQTPDPFAPVYERIETFNADCARVERPPRDPRESAARSLMRVSESVATVYQRKFVTALRVIFFATGAGVLSYLTYADVVPHAYPVVILYLTASAIALATYIAARRGRWQDRALDYRALEIGLQVQEAWDAAGLNRSVADYYIRRQHSELDWIRDAIRTVHTVDRQRVVDDTRAVATVREFVLGQYAYFAGTDADPRIAAYAGGTHFAGRAAREHRKAHLHHRLNTIALRVSFGFSIVLVAYGIVAWFAPAAIAGLPEEEHWHGDMMFAIGSTAAAAALFHEYPARRAHTQQARRYELMAEMYRRALDALDGSEQRSPWRAPEDGPPLSPIETARACILELGHESLSENGDWLLMHRERPIQLISVH